MKLILATEIGILNGVQLILQSHWLKMEPRARSSPAGKQAYKISEMSHEIALFPALSS